MMDIYGPCGPTGQIGVTGPVGEVGSGSNRYLVRRSGVSDIIVRADQVRVDGGVTVFIADDRVHPQQFVALFREYDVIFWLGAASSEGQ